MTVKYSLNISTLPRAKIPACLEIQKSQEDCHSTGLNHVSEGMVILLSPSSQDDRGKSLSGLTLVVWQ